MPERLLVNWLFHQPVGHLVEALRIASGFRAERPEVTIAVLVNARTPLRLARLCPAVDEVYGLDIGHPRGPSLEPDLSGLPRDWDYLYTDLRSLLPPTDWRHLDRVQARLRQWLRPGERLYADGDYGMPRLTNVAVTLDLPAAALARAERFWAGATAPRVLILPGSASFGKALGPGFWRRFMDAVAGRRPGATFAMLGVSGGGAPTLGIDAASVGELGVRDAFDLDIVDQLAIGARADVFVAPHSGMAFALHVTGTPWLSVAGHRWPEFVCNGGPFVAVTPSCPLYPCDTRILPRCRQRERTGDRPLCYMDEAAREKLPELLDALDLLLDGLITPEESARRHCAELERRGWHTPGARVWGWNLTPTPLTGGQATTPGG